MVNETRLPIWAAARTIYTCACVLSDSNYAKYLAPRLLPNYKIKLGEGLIFSDQQFLKILKNGFGFPEFKSLFLYPYRSMQSFKQLWQVGKLFRTNDSKKCAPILLHGSLEAICTYMNNHRKSGEVLEAERGSSLAVTILGTEEIYLIDHESKTGWSVSSKKNKVFASASLVFKNHHIAHKVSLGKVDSWVAMVKGDILLSGRIPLLDKFGYIARIAQREVPQPK